MSKFRSLYKNEMIKIFHKKSLAVVIAVTLLAIFSIGVFVKTFSDVFEHSNPGSDNPNIAYSALNDFDKVSNEKSSEMKKKLKAVVEAYAGKYGAKMDYSALATDILALSDCSKELYAGGAEYSYPLTEDRYDYLMNRSAILEYKITENVKEYLAENYDDTLYRDVTKAMIYVAFSITLVLIIILAGSTVSHEISSGSIKSLIIAPVKRTKIFWAKWTAILTAGFCVYLAEYLLIVIYSWIMFGFDDSYFIFVCGSKIYSMSIYLKNLIFILISFIPLSVFSTVALMMSCVTRNTAASVGGSMGIYYAGNTATSIVAMFFNDIFVKFIPFTHFNALSAVRFSGGDDVFGVLFKYTQSSSYNFYRSYADSSFWFSLGYLLVFGALMLWIAHNSFTKRDI